MKCHVKSLQKVSKVDKYMFHNKKYSEVYLRLKFSNHLIQRVPTLVPMTTTRPEVYIETMTIFLSYSCISLEETINHLKSIKLKSYPRENVAYLCDEILVDVERLESAGTFKPGHFGYITRFLWIILTTYVSFISFKTTRSLWKLSTNFIYDTWILYNYISSSLMSPFYKRLCMSTMKFQIQSGSNLLPESRGLDAIIFF